MIDSIRVDLDGRGNAYAIANSRRRAGQDDDTRGVRGHDRPRREALDPATGRSRASPPAAARSRPARWSCCDGRHRPARRAATAWPTALNAHARAYAAEHGLDLDETVPPFVALAFDHRTALVQRLTAPGPPREGAVGGARPVQQHGLRHAPPTCTPPRRSPPGHPGLLAMGYRAARTPTACGGSPTTPTAASWPTTAPATPTAITGARHDRAPRAPTSSSSAAASAARSRPTTWPPAAPRSSCWSAGRGWTGEDFDHDFMLGSSYTRVFDFIVGDGMSVLGGNCVGGGSVVYFAAHAPRAAVRLRAPRQHRPPDVAGGDQPRHARPVVRPGRRGAAGHPAGLGRRHLRRRAVGRGVRRTPGRTANPVPVGDRHRQVHQLQLDDGRLPVRRQALAAAQLPAGRAGARRRDPAAARGAAALPHRRRRLPGALQRSSTTRTTGSCTAAARSTRRSSSSRPAPAATPVILQRSEAHARRDAARRRPLLLRQRRAAQHRGHQRGQGARGARPVPRPTALAYEANQIGKGPTVASWDRLDGDAAGVRAVLAGAALLPARPRHHPRPGARRRPGRRWFGVEKKEMLQAAGSPG